MGDLALAGGPVAVDRDRALPVEVRGRVVAIQIGEHRRKRISSLEHDVGSLPSPSRRIASMTSGGSCATSCMRTMVSTSTSGS